MYTGDLLVAQMLVEVLHDNVTIKRYSSYAGVANAVEKGEVLWLSMEQWGGSSRFSRV